MNNLHLHEGKVAFRWSRWRNKKRQEVSYCLMVLFSGAVLLLGGGGVAVAGPTGGQVTSGTGTISQSGTTTTIDQTSNVLQINWQTFSTAPNETVNFNQPGSTSLAINRVVGGVPSYLQGALNANGRVYILNSAGITFAGTSRVNVGALLATTAMSIDGDVGGVANFSAPAGSGGSVINQGSITVSNGGFAILAAPYVQNTGFIQANLGTVALAGTNQFTLDLRGDGLINFVVPPGTAQEIVQDGQKVGVDNSGTIRAQSGQVLISANVASQVVNAVVNMTGIVDADAFAANGSGGTVMVTSAGDINLGGTITAQGNGTGAGGQIVTKAAGADNIESGANLLAAGGSQGGKGGFIDVSGKNFKLDGNIDPGAGGSLLIDPANILVTPGAGASSSGAAVVNELWLSNQLEHDINVILAATHDITFKGTNANANFTLLGGSGNFIVTANSNILFSNVKNYEIRTGSGEVALTANHGDIGSNSHRVSIVSGYGTDNGGLYSGVTQAGDVILKAGDDIFLRDVTVKSVTGGSSGDRHALFSADAGSSLNIAGNVDVEASAEGDVRATASALLFGNHINVAGNITVLANAHGTTSGTDVEAYANLMVAKAHSATGANPAEHDGSGTQWNTFGANDIHINGAVDVQAKADGSYMDSEVEAEARVLLAGKSITVNGAVTVLATATGNHIGTGESGSVVALARLIAERGSSGNSFASYGSNEHFGADTVHFANNIDVQAKAKGSDVSFSVDAKASAVLLAHNDVVDHNITVKATASNSNDSATFVGAKARLTAAEGFSSFFADGGFYQHTIVNGFSANVHIGGSIDVEAKANGGSLSTEGAVKAQALVDLVASSDGNAALGHIFVGGAVTVKAVATGHGTADGFASAVEANAVFLAAGREDIRSSQYGNYVESANTNPAGSILLDPDLTVTAKAHGSYVDTISALAAAAFEGSYVRVDGNVTISASATGFRADNIEADAALVVQGSYAFTYYDSGSSERAQNVNFLRPVDVTAKANGSHVSDSVTADAYASIQASTVLMQGAVDITANARGSSVGGDVYAVATLEVDPATVTFNNAVSVTASAFGNAVSGDVYAEAYVEVSASTVTFNGPVTVSAKASGTEVGDDVYADAYVETNDAGSVAFNGPVSVSANANGSYVGDDVYAEAYVETNSDNTVTFANSVNVTADAHGSSVGDDVYAEAYAEADYVGSIDYKGPVTVSASANGSNVGNEVYAEAYAEADYVGPGGVDYGNALTVTANASGRDVGSEVYAEAYASDYSVDGTVTFEGPVDIAANANGSHVGTYSGTGDGVHVGSVDGSVYAEAYVNLYNIDKVTFDKSVNVAASAHGSDVGVVSLNGNSGHIATGSRDVNGRVYAEGYIDASDIGSIAFDGAVTVTAKANGSHVGTVSASGNHDRIGTNDGSVRGNVYAEGDIYMNDIGTATFDPGVTVTASANGQHVGVVSVIGSDARVASASYGAYASVTGTVGAEAYIEASNVGTLKFKAPVTVTGKASGSYVGSVFASGNGAEIAVAHGSDAYASVDGRVEAEAYVNAYDIGSLTFSGAENVTAQAHGADVGVVSVVGNDARIGTADGYAYMSASIDGRVRADAYIDASSVGSLNFKQGVTVTALANGNHVGTVEANGNSDVIAQADHSYGGYAYASASGQISAQADVYVNDVGDATFHGVTISAKANGSHVGSVTANGNNTVVGRALGVEGYASISGSVSAEAYFEVEDVGTLNVNGGVNVSAQARGSDVGVVTANGSNAHVAVASGEGVYAFVTGSVSADAYVEASDIGVAKFNGAVTVSAQANGSHVGSVTANGNNARVASADGLYAWAAVEGSVSADASVNAYDIGSLGFAGAVNVSAQARGTDVGIVTANGSGAHVAVAHGEDAYAYVSGSVSADAYVNAYGQGSTEGSLTAEGAIHVSAAANGLNVGVVEANGNNARVASASGDNVHAYVDGSVSAEAYVETRHFGFVDLDGGLTITAAATGSHVGTVTANGNGAHVAIADGSDAVAQVSGSVSAEAYMSASEIGTGGHFGSLAVDKAVVITASANGKHVGSVTANGTDARVGHASGYAYASVDGQVYASAYIAASDFISEINFTGPVTVAAQADGTDVGVVTVNGSGGRFGTGDGYAKTVTGEVYASAYIDASSDSGVNFSGAVKVTAKANGSHVGSVTANGSGHVVEGRINGFVYAEAYVDVTGGGPVTFRGPLTVTAAANGFDVGVVNATGDGLVDPYTSGEVYGSAYIDASGSGPVHFGGSVGIHASANGQHVASSVYAEAYLNASDSSVAAAKSIVVTAKATGKDVGDDVYASASATFGTSYNAGNLGIGGALVVEAQARGTSVGDDVYANALGSASVFGAQIGGILVKGTANGNSVGDDVYASADFSANLGLGGVAVGAVDVEAHAAGDADNVCAFASADFSNSGVTRVNGPATVIAVASGNSVDDVSASAHFVADYSSGVRESFFGAITVEALANVGAGGAEFANAFASVDLDAAGNITIFAPGNFGPGVTAIAKADPQGHAEQASATASIEADAGGALFVHGNVTAVAQALGTGSFTSNFHDHAFASQDLVGSNVTLVGNLRSLAVANGSWASASATIQVHALGTPGNIVLLEQQDPIAQAVAGDPVTAFRQSHFSTSFGTTGPDNSHAFANIVIEPNTSEGGTTIVLNPTSTQGLALLALMAQQSPPPWTSSALSEIPLSIGGEDCGYLGAAGNPNANPACGKGPLNIAGQDVLP